MKQLGILDSAFVNMEHRNAPQHIGAFGIYDPSTAPGGSVRFKDVIARFETKLNKLPLFRTRLVEVPGGHDRPYWVKDADFDVEFHLRHISLPHPGDWRQLCILISRIHSRPIDMSRPLWEAYIIEGLDNIEGLPKNCFSVYTKIHHSLVDGSGGASFLEVLHDLEPNPVEEKPSTIDEDPNGSDQQIVIADKQPSAMQLRTNALFNRMSNYSNIFRSAVPLAKELGSAARDLKNGTLPMPPIKGPENRFAQPIGPYRALEASLLDLDGFKLIKNATATTINDVGLAVIAGAMRQYLQKHDELPEEALTGALPVNMRTRRGDNKENNQVGSAFTSLHTNMEDPIERLLAIHQSANEAKNFCANTPMADALKLAGLFSPRLSAKVLKLYVDKKLSKRLPINISTIVSNVPGPNFPLYSCGAKLVRYHGIGLLTPGVGLFHMIFSYSGQLSLTILADRELLPDPGFYKQCIDDSYKELKAAATKLVKVQEKKALTKTAKSTESTKPKVIKKKASSSSASSSTKLNVVKDVPVKEAGKLPEKEAG